MKTACLIALALLAVVSSPAAAVDLSDVSRAIAAEPKYQTQPKYGLLVFGPETATRVWLVHDGNTLYADVNGDGDLTDSAERFIAHELSDVDDRIFRFDVGEIHEGELLHKSLSVRTMNLQHLAQSSRSDIRKVLAKDSQARVYGLGIHLEMPGHRGRGIDGRVEHLVSPIDAGGLLMFADTPDEAPIIHFGGPWQITLFGGESTLTAGRQTEVFLGLGTPGLGPGTTAFAAYQDLVPAGKSPKLHVTPPGDNEQTIEYVLRERCCTVNFHGGVRLPDGTPTGVATVNVSFNDWFGGFAAPTTHKVRVAKPKVEIELEPVSSRLKASLMHRFPGGDIVGVRYSPDGSRIIAGDYPGGVIQVWDSGTGEALTTIETGYELRSREDYFHVTPDWKSVYVTRKQRERTRIERDGKKMTRWEFDGGIRCWNLETGELQSVLQHSPTRGILRMVLSSDGRHILTGEQVPGEYEGRGETSVSLWDTQTGDRRHFSDARAHCIISADGSRFAVDHQSYDEHSTMFKLFDTQSGQQTLSIPIAEQSVYAVLMDFTPDSTLLIGQLVPAPTLKDRGSYPYFLKFWDTRTGKEVGSIKAGNRGVAFSWPGTFSPDGQTYLLGNNRSERSELYLIDLASRRISTTVDLGERWTLRAQVFSPDGRWIAATTQYRPENMTAYTTAEDLRQPRIHLIEAATGQIRETIVAPQCFLGSLCFSPDGRTLASSGPGRVLLWDVSRRPGQSGER